MKRRLTQKEQEQEEIVKIKIAAWFVFIGSIMFVLIIAQNIFADTITHKFKSPSFSGNATSSHYLTIENLTFNREESNSSSDKKEVTKKPNTPSNCSVIKPIYRTRVIKH